MFCILAACTTLAVVLWVGLAYQHKQKNHRRAKAAQGEQAWVQLVELFRKEHLATHPSCLGPAGTLHCCNMCSG